MLMTTRDIPSQDTTGCKVEDLGFRAQGFHFECLGFWVSGYKVRVPQGSAPSRFHACLGGL